MSFNIIYPYLLIINQNFYPKNHELGIIVEFNDGGTKNLKGKELDYETTQFIFKRLDKVKMIVVNVNK